MSSLTSFAPVVEIASRQYWDVYQEHCDRVYCLAFWMTDNELEAEQLSANTFLRAFAGTTLPSTEQVDRAFVAEVRERMPIGTPTLHCPVSAGADRALGRIKRIFLERAVVQIPPTEKLIFLMHDVENYDHSRIMRLLGISREESQEALHQARLQIRELIAAMQ